MKLIGAPMLRRLDGAVTALVLLVVGLRPLSAGQPAYEPETVLLGALVWIAATLWTVRQIGGGEIVLRRGWIWLPLGLFALLTALSVARAGWTPYSGPMLDGIAPLADGDAQAALDLGLAWAADLLLLVLVVHHFRDPARWRLLAATLLASLAVVVAYSLYQRGYALDYFRGTVTTDDALFSRVAGADPSSRELMALRLGSDRVSGPFAYANALAAFVLLLLPMLAGAVMQGEPAAHRTWRRLLMGIGAVALLALVFSGSKAGFLAAKLFEMLALFHLLRGRDNRPGRTLLDCAAGVTLATLTAGLLTAACYGLATAVSGAGVVVAQIVYALLWALEWWVLARRLERPLSGWQRWAGTGLAAAGCALVLWLAIGTATLPAPLQRAREVVRTTVLVRGGYWAGAWKMLEAYPLRGVGLDNFGSRYTQFKPVWSWAVQRVHNHYLQLAADGGLPLLAAFVGVWTVYFLGRRRRPGEAGSVDGADVAANAASARAMADASYGSGADRVALLLAVGIFGLLYLGFLVGLFAGLSLEFALLEWTGGENALRTTTGSWLPFLIHAGLHLLVLPGLWWLTFRGAQRVLAQVEPRRLAPWLRLGVAAVLLHAVADFHLSVTSISAVFWCVAGLALAAEGRWTTLRLSGRRQTATLIAAGGVLLLVLHGVVMPHVAGGLAADAVAERALMAPELQRDPEEVRDALALTREAIRLRPRDPALRRHLAEFEMLGLLRQRRMAGARVDAEQTASVLAAWREAIERDPWRASLYANYARALLLLQPGERARQDASEAFDVAMRLHPWQPAYRLEAARLALMMAKRERAADLLLEALRIDAAVTDRRAHLSEAETAEVRALLLRLGQKASPVERREIWQ